MKKYFLALCIIINTMNLCNPPSNPQEKFTAEPTGKGYCTLAIGNLKTKPVKTIAKTAAGALTILGSFSGFFRIYKEYSKKNSISNVIIPSLICASITFAGYSLLEQTLFNNDQQKKEEQQK